MQWSKEVQVDEWVREKLKSMGLKLGKDFLEKDASAYLKDALKGASKTKKQSGTGIPDFVIEKYKVDDEVIPVIFECKLGIGKLEKYAKDNEKALDFSNNAISKYALNGALHYARVALQNESQKQDHYKEIIAIGIAGDNSQNVRVKIACVFADSSLAYKEIKHTNLDFLENAKSFTHFYKEECKLTEEDKHLILIRGKWHLSYHSAQLNKLMHNHNITAPQRVLYIAGMILSMQSVMSNEYRILTKGLSPADLQGSQEEGLRDGELVFERIEEFLKVKVPDSAKRKLMLDSFNEIRKDTDRDKIPKNFTYKEGEKKNPNHKIIAHILKEPSSINKQIFAYIYAHIYKEIDGLNGHLDIMGECYSEFLKYALGDGKELGIVLTPPYVTKMMTQILDITSADRVMDLATGSAGFLISSMEQMIEDVYKNTAKHSTQANKAILELKTKQLLGIEYNAEMFALATSNMILRGDGSSKIYKANTFETEDSLYVSFAPTRILLNPPFTWDYNGLPFIEFGLDRMQKHGLGAIIIQDSAGNGQATPITQSILTKHTLKASIKMPIDLFQPMAGVQTSIYIFEAKIPHDFEKPVKFIDFRNDGYKRTKRSLQEVDKPAQRYKDILKIYKQGLNAKLDNSVYEKPINLSEVYVEDFISESGADWNFDQHKKIDTTPTLQDFKKCVSEYLAWEVSNVLKNQNSMQGGLEGNALSPRLAKLEKDFKQNGGEWREFKLGGLFEVSSSKKIFHANQITIYNDEIPNSYPYVVRSTRNNGVRGYLCENRKYLNPANTLSFAQDTFSVFYQEKPYFTGNKVKVLTPKFKPFTKIHALFFASIYQKVLETFTWGVGSTEDDIKDIVISLPVLPTPCHTEPLGEVSSNTESRFFANAQSKASLENDKINIESNNYQIAFDYMESYIKELEAERLEELEAYLKVTGLNDYTLSQKEKDALKAFENLSALNERERERVSGISHEMPLKALQDSTLIDSREWQSFANTALSTLAQKELESSSAKDDIEWKSFNFDKVFKYERGKRYKKLDHTSGQIPYISSSALNNGIDNYVNPPSYMKRYNNKITLANSGSVGSCFYHSYEFVASDHCMVVWLKDRELNRYLALFFNAIFEKALKPKYEFSREINHERLMAETFFLPTKDNTIDFNFMESFIKAIEKQHIETLYRFWESKLKAYNAVINWGGGGKLYP